MNIVAIRATATYSAHLCSRVPVAAQLFDVMRSSLPFVDAVAEVVAVARHAGRCPCRRALRLLRVRADAPSSQSVDPLECALRPILTVLVDILLLRVCPECIDVGRVDLLAVGL